MRDSINLSGDFRSARVSIVTDGRDRGGADPRVKASEADESFAAMPLSEVPRPSRLPGGSVLPWRANRHFVGRESDLLLLATALSDGAVEDLVRVVAASGIGGVGKTQVAVEFAHRYGRYFAGGVYWIDCGEPDGIAPQIANCAVAMGLSPSFGVDDRVVLVRTAWQGPTPRLIILDGCEHDEVLARWCPVTGGCRVLVTCRRPGWNASLNVRSVPVKPLPRRSSTALLLRSRPDLAADDPEVAAIAESLGDLPLALHLAASFLSRFKHSALGEPGRYLASLSASPILDHVSLGPGGWSPTGHEQHVARTFAVTYDRLDETDPVASTAKAMLAFACWLAPSTPIQRWILVPTARSNAEVDEEATLRQEAALACLLDLGFLEEEGIDGSVVIHRLVGQFARSRECAEEARMMVADVLSHVAEDLQTIQDPRPFAAWAPHFVDFVASAPAHDANAAESHRALGRFQYACGEFLQARRTFETALSLTEKVNGPEHRLVGLSLGDLAITLRVLGETREAAAALRRAMAIHSLNPAETNIQRARLAHNLGQVLAAEDPPAAFEAFDVAVSLLDSLPVEDGSAASQQESAPDSSDGHRAGLLVRCLTGMADTLRSLDTRLAYAAVMRALHEASSTFGGDAFEMWAPLTTAGHICLDARDPASARSHLESACEVLSRWQGSDTPLLGDVLLGLADAYFCLGDFDTALAHADRVRALAARHLGATSNRLSMIDAFVTDLTKRIEGRDTTLEGDTAPRGTGEPLGGSAGGQHLHILDPDSRKG